MPNREDNAKSSAIQRIEKMVFYRLQHVSPIDAKIHQEAKQQKASRTNISGFSQKSLIRTQYTIPHWR